MSSYWRQNWYGAISFFLFAIWALALTGAHKTALLPSFSSVHGGVNGGIEEKTGAQRGDEEIQRPADFFVDQERSDYQGYTIERRLRRVLLDSGGYGDSPGIWIDVAYINLKDKNKLLKTFDADVYFGAGNSANFGFFPFLSDGNKQLFISQDIARGGCQWVVSLSPRLRIMFNGERLGVGREGSDLGALDLDDDGNYEIMAPVTDFYEFHDKMSMSEIPLPTIVFKYDRAGEEYLPANPLFTNYVFQALEQVPRTDETLQSQTQHRSAMLNNLLTYIYAGKEKQGWDFYDNNYQLNDKEEIRSRVKRILRKQPVYNLIYKRVKRK